MSSTPVLGLPLIAAAQAQKHVTHNEALLALDALVHCAVLDKDLAVPPAATAGQRYIVPAGSTGEWAGKATMIAAWQEGYGWRYFAPARGYLAFVADESLLYVFDGTAWASLTSALAAIQNLGRLGIGTTADATNPFSAKLNKALWTARTAAEGGDGDLRYTLNKETASDVLSLLFQTGFSGRLELGLVGSDDPVVKVSSDGSSWRTALAIQGSTGGLDYLSASTSVASAGTTDIGSAPTRKVDITGTTTTTSFGSGAHKERLVRFAGALTLTHNATSLILPGGANIVTAAGDAAHATSDGSGNWTVRHYQRADGTPLVLSPSIIFDPSHASVGLGYQSLSTSASGTLSGSANCGIGSQALVSVTSGGYNTALGYSSLFALTTGSQNTALGSRTLASVTSGSGNTAVGEFAMQAALAASGCTAVGLAALYATDYSNCTGLGAATSVTGNNQVQLGESSTTVYAYGSVQNRSDIRDKADVRDTVLGLDFILAVRPVDFRWDMREDYRPPAPTPPGELSDEATRAAFQVALTGWSEASRLQNLQHDGSKKRSRFHSGLIAQDVRDVLVSMGADFGGYQDHSFGGGDDVQSLGYDEFIAPLIKAVQELHARNGAFEARLASLESRSS